MSKLSQNLMDELFFKSQIDDPDVIMGPKFGEDAAILKIGDSKLVVHTDPISGAVEEIGWLAITIAANDIAVTGAEPRWALCSVQVPDGTSETEIKKVAHDLSRAADGLNVTIIGGHTEVVTGIDRPLISTTMMGVTDEPVLTSGSEEGDNIVQIKPAGIEGSWILANDYEDQLIEKGIDERVIKKVKGWREDISVVQPALNIRDRATSLHDPTEGGILQGLYEMATCSGNDFIIDGDIDIREETRHICDVLNIDPLYLISSGCLLATIPKEVDYGEGNVIGEVRNGEGRVVYKGEEIKERPNDELFRIIKELN
ncbi:MAG: AIR synthase family protein [Candidatus Saliniplasma sp.]